MKAFEEFGATKIWSVYDVDVEGERGMAAKERREAITRYLKYDECTEDEWLAISRCEGDVIAKRKKAA